jgi:hypothetical protein
VHAVRPVSPWTRRVNVAALAVAVGLASDIVLGVMAVNSPRGVLNGVPFFMHFFVATVMIAAAAGDLRIMRFGVPRGGPRLARHSAGRYGGSHCSAASGRALSMCRTPRSHTMLSER